MLAHLAATGHGADAYDFATQAAFLKSLNMPPHWICSEPRHQGHRRLPIPADICVLYAPFCRYRSIRRRWLSTLLRSALLLAIVGRLRHCRAPAAIALLFYFALRIYTGVQSLLFSARFLRHVVLRSAWPERLGPADDR